MTAATVCERNANASCGSTATALCTDGRTDVLTEMHSPSDESSSTATHAGGLHAESGSGHGTARRQQSEDPTTRAVAVRPAAVDVFRGRGPVDVQSFPGRPLARTTTVRAASTPLTRHRAASSATQRHHEADQATLQRRSSGRPRLLRSSATGPGIGPSHLGRRAWQDGLWQTGVGNGLDNTSWTTRSWVNGFVACSPIARWHGRSDGSDPLRPSRLLTADRCKETIALCLKFYREAAATLWIKGAATGAKQ